MKRFLLVAALAATMFNPAAASAEVIDTVEIDTNDSASEGWAGPYSTRPLDAGTYRITIKGTASYWGPTLWAPSARNNGSPVCDGTPERLPITQSSGVENGPVSLDPAFVFAYPRNVPVFCPNGSPEREAPFRYRSLEISLDGGKSFRSIDPVEGAYNSDHAYKYAVKLTEPTTIEFRFRDSNTRDNYGVFIATIEQMP
jgi:hypothetical protein